MKLAPLALAVAACGRFGFDPVVAGDGGTGDVMVDPSFVLTTTLLSTALPHSWVDLAVDWSQSLAYIGTRGTGECFAVVDFATQPPAIVQRRGPPATSGTTCLGVRLIDAQHLLVSSFSNNSVELWDLGADPRAGNFVRTDSLPNVFNARRIAVDRLDPARFYVGRGFDAPGYQVVTRSGTTLAATGSFDSAAPCQDHDNEVIDLATKVVLSACADNNAPVEIVDDRTDLAVGSIPATLPGVTTGFWSAASSTDGKLAVVLGWVNVIAVADPAMIARISFSARFRNFGDDVYRGVTFAVHQGQPTFWGTRSGASGGFIDAISVADPSDPVIVGSGTLGVAGEPYQMSISPAGDRGIVVTNDGWFAVVDPTRIPVTQLRWPAF